MPAATRPRRNTRRSAAAGQGTPSGARHLRPAQGELRQVDADLFLGRARSDRAQPPGTGRRPAISFDRLPANDEQARLAQAYIAQLDGTKVFGKKIVTTIERGKPFYAAEDYHQDYLTLHPNQPYIAINDLPKVANLKRMFPDAYRAEPALVSKTGM